MTRLAAVSSFNLIEESHFLVYPYTDDFGRTFYPMRYAYAVNLSKVQGETLDHMAFWLDTPGIHAASYVGISRVRSLSNILFLGWLTTRHTLPSREADGVVSD